MSVGEGENLDDKTVKKVAMVVFVSFIIGGWFWFNGSQGEDKPFLNRDCEGDGWDFIYRGNMSFGENNTCVIYTCWVNKTLGDFYYKADGNCFNPNMRQLIMIMGKLHNLTVVNTSTNYSKLLEGVDLG